MENALEQLRIMTEHLPAVPKLGDFKHLVEGRSNGQVTYNVDNGVCHSYLLFESPAISVARIFLSGGATFPEHLHIESEYGLIYSGSVVVSVDNKERVLGIGDCLKVDPSLPHWAKSLEDTWFIAITIPSSKDFPKND